MKKLLVLMLVLGMASAANATTLSWSVDAVTINLGQTAVVQLVANNEDPYDPKSVGQTPGATPSATIASIVARAAAGPDSQVKNPSQTGYAGWWTVMALDLDPFTTPNITAGAQFDVTISCLALGTEYFGSDAYGTNNVLTVVNVPEPMTVALLGLGGLFMLRRRKK